MTDNVSGAGVWIELLDESGQAINPDEHPSLYLGQERDGRTIYMSPRWVSVTNDSPGPFDQVTQALAPYIRIAQGLAGFVSGDPDLGSLGNIFSGFRDAVVGGQSALGDVTKFVRNEMTLTVPYPHPSRLSKIKLHSAGESDQMWVLPDLLPAPGTYETRIPGVRQNVSGPAAYANATTVMEFDLERIAQGEHWKAFFFNDGENERFFPILYWFRSGECAVLLVVKLRFIRYNWAPEIKTGVGVADFSHGPSSVFVDPEADSVREYPLPSGASSEITEMQSCRVIKWQNGKVSLGYDDNPLDNLTIYAVSRSVRLRYRALGSQRNWGVVLEVDSPQNLQGFPIYVSRLLPHINQPNSEPDQNLTQEIPGQLLMPGVNYTFDIIIKDGDPNRRFVRRKILNVVNPQLSITSITPLTIARGGKVVIQGEFGYDGPPGDVGAPGFSILQSVEVGSEIVPWERRGQELVVGPIHLGGIVRLKFWDSSTVTSAQRVVASIPTTGPHM